MLIIEKALKQLRENLQSMTEVVLDMLELVHTSLEKENINDLEVVFKQDKHLDQLEKSLDRQCMELLALINPHASDLRFVFSVIKTNVDLERMGDEMKNVAREMKNAGEKVPPEMKELARMVSETARKTFRALANSDSKMAMEIILEDDQIDTMEYNIVQKYPQLGISLTAKALERIADHATNIAENIIYSVEGIDVRHENSIRQRLAK
ncbi:MAG TPA: phosphate signaling complex protein PhoU [Turneriella sp.]|nr:phosphate signaling complex protein PhoU [Turneriella sp.]HMY10157.1 phosphate signaling complex protein PhoU [Turneriella sp.]HNA78087.1 phosphate signaling complex protein PhoU [Turneriella sp.]HNE19722.1 phosphate signaling complex protein PhoU [Turneriella sp.]HNJ64299.1 phosphate signaling complex protein PhoU [Turneriella sp.]